MITFPHQYFGRGPASTSTQSADNFHHNAVIWWQFYDTPIIRVRHRCHGVGRVQRYIAAKKKRIWTKVLVPLLTHPWNQVTSGSLENSNLSTLHNIWVNLRKELHYTWWTALRFHKKSVRPKLLMKPHIYYMLHRFIFWLSVSLQKHKGIDISW